MSVLEALVADARDELVSALLIDDKNLFVRLMTKSFCMVLPHFSFENFEFLTPKNDITHENDDDLRRSR